MVQSKRNRGLLAPAPFRVVITSLLTSLTKQERVRISRTSSCRADAGETAWKS
jgi:hypothetical protein